MLFLLYAFSFRTSCSLRDTVNAKTIKMSESGSKGLALTFLAHCCNWSALSERTGYFLQGPGATARAGQGCLEEEHSSAAEGDTGTHAEAVREPAGDSD